MPARTNQTVDVYDTPGELDPSDPKGQLALVLDPLALYVLDAGGTYQVLSTGASAPVSTPASESTAGAVELATEAEVQEGASGILVATAARLKAELDRRAIFAASETTAGTVELATASETLAGTDTTRAVHPAGLKAAIAQPALLIPILTSGWVEYGGTYAPPRYYKDPFGLVHLQGLVKDGALGSAETLFTLISDCRPASDHIFATLGGGGAVARVDVLADGRVVPFNAQSNGFLSLSGISFKAA